MAFCALASDFGGLSTSMKLSRGRPSKSIHKAIYNVCIKMLDDYKNTQICKLTVLGYHQLFGYSSGGEREDRE